MKAEDDDGDGDDGDPFDGDGSDDANSPWRQKGYQLPWHERNGEGGGRGHCHRMPKTARAGARMLRSW